MARGYRERCPGPDRTDKAAARALGVLGYLALVVAGLPTDLPAQSVSSGRLTVTSRSRFENSAITESSGVAVGRTLPGIIWTHNDGSHPPRLYAVDSIGRDRGYLEVAGASNRDWEDIALGSCPEGSCLYLADTGNNNRRRDVFTIYRVPDPDGRQLESGEVGVLGRLEFRYPGGPIDTEAMYLAPSGEIYLIGKLHPEEVQHFKLPAAPWPADTVTAQVVPGFHLPGRSRLSRITGADLSRDGTGLVVRTYRDLLFYRRTPDGTIAGPDYRCSVLGLESQGEGVAWLDDRRVVLSSERGLLGSGVITIVECHH